MRCPQCHHENRDGAKFCRACGAKLDLSCPSCGTVNEPGAAFCDHCGSALTAQQQGKRQKDDKQSRVRRLASRVKKTADSGPRTADSGPVSYTPPHLADRIRAEQAALEARGVPDGELKTIGAASIKGARAPINVYEVVSTGPLRTKLQVAARRGLVRFVGRQSEMEQLHGALEQAKAGHGQIIGVMGEPGVGKSRLFYEFKLTSRAGCLVLEAYSVSHGQASPYLPVIELLKQYLAITVEDDERKRREKVIGKVLGLDRSLEDLLPFLFALLGIEDPDATLQQMDPQMRRRRTFAALKRLFLRESLNQPLILIFEDLHWIDTETQGFLEALGESVGSARLFLLTNYRPEYHHEWGRKTYYTQLHLAPLSRVDAAELLTFLLGNDGSLRALKPLILAKTEGTPFFMEEVVQRRAET